MEERQQVHQAPNSALFRHRAICISCFWFAVLVMVLSTQDLKQLISQPASIDKSFKIKFEQVPELPTQLNYSQGSSSNGFGPPERYLRENRAIVSEFSDKGEQLFGFVDANAKLVIKPQFSQVYNFQDGLAAVGMKGSWGFIEPSGKFVIQPQFESCTSFHNGVAAVVVKDVAENYGALIDKSGKIIARTDTSILPGRSGSFYVVQAKVAFGDELPKDPTLRTASANNLNLKIKMQNSGACSWNYKFGLMDQHGKWVVAPVYERIESINHRSSFNCGLAQSSRSDRKNVSGKEEVFRVFRDGHYGLINSSGIVLVPLKFQEVMSHFNGVTSVKVDGRIELLDRTGKPIFEQKCRAYDPVPRVDEPLLPVKDENGTWSVFDIDGKPIKNAASYTPEFTPYGEWFSEGLAPVCVNKKFGYIDTHGEMVIKPRFARATHFSEGMAAVRDGSGWVYIDRAGRFASPQRFDSVGPFMNGHARVSAKGPLSFIVQPLSPGDAVLSGVQGEYERAFDESGNESYDESIWNGVRNRYEQLNNFE